MFEKKNYNEILTAIWLKNKMMWVSKDDKIKKIIKN